VYKLCIYIEAVNEIVNVITTMYAKL